MGFRAVFEDPSTVTAAGLSARACATWTVVDATYWGEVSADEFLITVGCDGLATSVTPRIMRESLVRAGGGEERGAENIGLREG
jgi:hypothetical protein